MNRGTAEESLQVVQELLESDDIMDPFIDETLYTLRLVNYLFLILRFFQCAEVNGQISEGRP